MNAIYVALGAASLASISNYFFRRCNAAAAGYLTCYYFVSLCLVFAINPQLFSQEMHPFVVAIGYIAGTLSATMMYLIAQALKRGPIGLTFTFQSAGTVFPNMILFLLFGPTFGFVITHAQLIGMALVLFGLYMASKTDHKSAPVSAAWLKYALGCFAVQTLILTIFQWRCLLFSCDAEMTHPLIPTLYSETDDAWFIPSFFAGAFLLQSILFLREGKPMSPQAALFGGMGGITNGIATTLLLLATKMALPLEKGIIFPAFAVTVIMLCSLWGWKLYREQPNVKAVAICASGILIASLF